MRLNMRDFGARTDRREDELTQRFDIRNTNVHQIVVSTTNVVRRDDRWQGAAMLSKSVNNVAGVSRESHGDERLQRGANGPRRDIRVVTAQHAARFEPAHSGEGAGFGQPDTRGQLFVG